MRLTLATSIRPHRCAQCGVAIRTLRDELPRAFVADLSYDIYRDDITFIDNISSLPGGLHSHITHGKARAAALAPRLLAGCAVAPG